MSFKSTTYGRKTGGNRQKSISLPPVKPLILYGFLQALTGALKPGIIAI